MLAQLVPGGNEPLNSPCMGLAHRASAATIGGARWGTGANGIGFGTTLDGGSSSDVRAYSSAATTSYASGNAVYQARQVSSITVRLTIMCLPLNPPQLLNSACFRPNRID